MDNNNLFEGAAAIWAALDELVEKDPEYYKKFIESTLSQGPPSGANKTQPKTSEASKSGHLDSDITSLFAKLSTGKPEMKSNPTEAASTKTSKSACKETSVTLSAKSSASLLDDELGKSSIIASIIPTNAREDTVDELGKNLPEDIPIAVAIPDPSKDNKTRKSKPLIEEI